MDSEDIEPSFKLSTRSTTDFWGYIVCCGTVITFIASIGHVNCFGLIYNDFIIDTRSSAKSLTTAHGVFAIMLAIGGLILNLIAKRYTLREGGYLGAVMLSVGSLLTITITNTNQLSLTFGVLQGIGFGIMVPICYATINQYFAQKRTVVMSVCKATQGIILMGYPQLIELMMSSYGFRGTLLLLTGISLHAFPGMATMKAREERSWKRTANETIRLKNQENFDLLGHVNEFPDPNEAKQSTRKTQLEKIRCNIAEFLNIKVWTDLVYCNICIGQSFMNFSDLTFFILHPMLLFQYGYDTTNVAMCISIGAGADVAGRCGLALLGCSTHLNTRLLFYMATFFTLILRIVLLQVRGLVWVALVTGALGFLRAWLHVASPLVIADHVPHDEFPGAYATYMLATGVIQVICAPLVGLIRDVYEDYTPAFYTLTLCCTPCLVMWPIEYFFNKKM